MIATIRRLTRREPTAERRTLYMGGTLVKHCLEDAEQWHVWRTDAGLRLLTYREDIPDYIHVLHAGANREELAELGKAIIDCLGDSPEGQDLAAFAMARNSVALLKVCSTKTEPSA